MNGGSMAEEFKCPRCGFEQAQTDTCSKCGINIPRYIELQKSRRIIPSRDAQKRREERTEKPPEKPQSEGSLRLKIEEPVQDKPLKEEPAAPGIITHPREDIVTKSDLSRIGELFSRSWEVYKSRIWTLILLYLLTIVFFAVSFGIFIGFGFILSQLFPGIKIALLAATGFTGAIAGLIASCWGLGAFVCAVSDEEIGIGEALGRGWQRVGAFIWLFSILGYIITGGFLLLVIPGVIFSIWFLFSQFILAKEDEHGMNALLKSKEYVKGYWFDVFLRIFLVWLISGVLGMIPFIGPVLSFVFFPFIMIYTYLIYDDLKSMKGDVAYDSSDGEKFKWIGISTVGYVIVPILIIAFLGASLTTSMFFLMNLLKSKGQNIQFPQEQQPPVQEIPFGTITRLEGVWTGSEINGTSGWTFTIRGNTIDVKGPDGREWYNGIIKVDEGTEPGVLDVLIMQAPAKDFTGKISPGIFRLEGNTLITCGNAPGQTLRPSSFTPEKGRFRCFEISRESQPPMTVTPSSPEATFARKSEQLTPHSTDKLDNIMVYIYSLNYKGMVRLNGETLYEIKGEKDMNYNYTGGGKFHYGKNIIDVEYDSLPNPWKTELKIKVYKYDWDKGREDLINEWVINDKGGGKSLEVELNKP